MCILLSKRSLGEKKQLHSVRFQVYDFLWLVVSPFQEKKCTLLTIPVRL